MSRPRLHEDTIEALDALAIKDESYDTIIWKLLADAGHVEPDEEEEEDEEELSFWDKLINWIQSGEEEYLEE